MEYELNISGPIAKLKVEYQYKKLTMDKAYKLGLLLTFIFYTIIQFIIYFDTKEIHYIRIIIGIIVFLVLLSDYIIKLLIKMSVREKTNYAKKLTKKPKLIVNNDALLIVDENFSLSMYWHNINSITTDGDFIIIKNNTAEKFSILHTAEFSNNDATIFIMMFNTILQNNIADLLPCLQKEPHELKNIYNSVAGHRLAGILKPQLYN